MRSVHLCLFALLIVSLTSCPQSQTRPPLTNPPVMDLVIGDMGLQTAKSSDSATLEHAKVLVYFDVLNRVQTNPAQQPAPDLTLGVPQPAKEESGFAILNPVDVEFNSGDLYLVDQKAKRVYIWRNYRSHHDYDAPDVVLLNNIAQAQSPWELIVTHDCLFVSDFYRGLLAWKNAGNIVTDDLPDVVIASATNSMLSGMEVDTQGNLFISWLSGGIEVYYDFINEYMADTAIQADVTLSGPSFEYMTAPIWKILVANNVVYAHTHSSSSTLFVFSPADALTDNQAPDAVITPTLGRLNNPFSMAVAGDTLLVGNMFSDYVGVCGFRPANALEIGQQPSLMLDYFRSGMGPCSNLCIAQNILFATSSTRPVCGKAAFMQDMNIGDVHIFGHADQIIDADQADIIIKGGLDFLVPLSIDAEIVSTD